MEFSINNMYSNYHHPRYFQTQNVLVFLIAPKNINETIFPKKVTQNYFTIALTLILYLSAHN
jgi:hypothetical protein